MSSKFCNQGYAPEAEMLAIDSNASECYHLANSLAKGVMMASLSIRKLDEKTIKKLRQLAVRDNVSMEEEVRRILIRAVNAPNRLGDLALQFFGQENGVDLSLPQHRPQDPEDFTK